MAKMTKKDITATKKILFEELQKFKETKKISIVNPVEFSNSYGLNVQLYPIKDSKYIFDIFNVKLESKDGYDILGFFIINDGKKYFIVDQDMTMNRMRYVIAYAVGKYFTIVEKMTEDNTVYGYVTESCLLDIDEKTLESIYAKFAREMIMPEDDFIKLYNNTVKLKYKKDKLGIVARSFNVDFTQTELRCKELNL